MKQTVIFFDTPTDEICRNIQLVAMKEGYKWAGSGLRHDLPNHFESRTLAFTPDDKRIRRSLQQLDIVLSTFNKDNNILLPKNIIELKYLLSGRKYINYNEPKKLVYE